MGVAATACAEAERPTGAHEDAKIALDDVAADPEVFDEGVHIGGGFLETAQDVATASLRRTLFDDVAIIGAAHDHGFVRFVVAPEADEFAPCVAAILAASLNFERHVADGEERAATAHTATVRAFAFAGVVNGDDRGPRAMRNLDDRVERRGDFGGAVFVFEQQQSRQRVDDDELRLKLYDRRFDVAQLRRHAVVDVDLVELVERALLLELAARKPPRLLQVQPEHFARLYVAPRKGLARDHAARDVRDERAFADFGAAVDDHEGVLWDEAVDDPAQLARERLVGDQRLYGLRCKAMSGFGRNELGGCCLRRADSVEQRFVRHLGKKRGLRVLRRPAHGVFDIGI